jgi:hypothetical protein
MTVVQMPPRAAPATLPSDEVMARTLRVLDEYAADLDRLMRIGRVLRTFYEAPFSMGAIHPVLVLALELNPDLAEPPA